MLVDSQSDLPVFPHFCCASKHDSHGFLHAFFRMKSFLPDYTVSKVLLDSAHDAMPYYQYFKRENITPFIDLNGKGGRPPVYKNDFTIDKDGVPVCPSGCRMRRDGIEVAKGRMKFKCPKISHAGGCISCTCENPCSNAKYGRTVHLVLKDNPRLFNDPPRSSKEKKKLQSPHQRLKLLLNISITPTIRPSPYIHALHLYSATRKISLSFGERPLTSYPGFRPSLHRNGYLQISPSIQIFPHYFCHTATFTGYFRYRRISPPSKQSALLALPLSYQLPH
jgi:hypothetical protein